MPQVTTIEATDYKQTEVVETTIAAIVEENTDNIKDTLEVKVSPEAVKHIPLTTPKSRDSADKMAMREALIDPEVAAMALHTPHAKVLRGRSVASK